MSIAAAIIPVTPFQQNCALIWDQDTKRGAVIDPGGDAAQIEAAIAETGITIDRILLTHGHMDHAGGAAELQRALRGTKKVRIEGPHKADAFLLSSLDKQGQKYGLQCKPVTPDRWLEEGDEVEIAGSLQVADVIEGGRAVRAAGGTLAKEPEPENGEPPHLAMCVDPEGNEFMLTRRRA